MVEKDSVMMIVIVRAITNTTMKLIIPKEVEKKIHDYVMSVDSEIAGMGKVSVSPTGDTITVEDVMIYEQEVTGGTADLSSKSIAKWQSDLVKAGGSPKHWKLWWHSHDNMSAFFSGIDTATMDAQTEGDWMCSLVVNKRRERQARLDLYRPFRMFMDNLTIQIGIETEAEPVYKVPKHITDEVAKKVKRPAPTMGYGYSRGMYGEVTGYETDYTRDQLISITKTLQTQIAEYDDRGQGDSAEAQALTAELIDAYYELAEVEPSKSIADNVRAEAQELENALYSIDYTQQNELTLPL